MHPQDSSFIPSRVEKSNVGSGSTSLNYYFIQNALKTHKKTQELFEGARVSSLRLNRVEADVQKDPKGLEPLNRAQNHENRVFTLQRYTQLT